ncbi:MAG TPA: NmrA family NAD(P)-binding protein [Streptosporangiaceae bacterium]|nr:NmrA family NAD(P)-binding protein [Streptosporangiaceae bacterium]
MITVTGATGMTGRHVIAGLLDAGLPVRALAHSPASARQLPGGVHDVVTGDMLIPADAERAITGADAVVHIGPAMHPREIAMGETVIDAAAAAGAGHFVLMSVTHPQLEPLLNHQSKLAAERQLLMSRLPFTILQPMHYMQDVDVSRSVADGTYRQPYSLDVELSFVDLADVGQSAALVLSDPGPHRFATYELCGADTLTGRQVAAILTEVAGRPVQPQQLPVDQALARMRDAPDYTRDAMRRLAEHYDSYGITGNPNVLSWLLGREPTSFAEYVRRALDA